MKNLIILLILWGSFIPAIAQQGAITGTIIDRNRQALAGAIVQAIQNGKKMGGAQTNANGQYRIGHLQPGRYEVKISLISYQSKLVKAVIVSPGKTVHVNAVLEEKTKDLKELQIVAYKVPLIGEDERRVIADDIEKMPTRSTTSMASVSAGIYQSPKMYFNPSTESYKKEPENDFRTVATNPLSTLSVDVDRASYSNVRRFINQGQMPPSDAVRIEEIINYFDYEYPQPTGKDPISITTELTSCPWASQHQLLHIGIQARSVSTKKLPASNLVFLIDVSGSMGEYNKLPLVVSSLKMLTDQLREKDRVSIVVYAGNAGLVLPSTPGNEKTKIKDALDRLSAGGYTAGGEGIRLAYDVALKNFVKGGNNRVILATVGDFNVGVSNENELEDLITNEREKGIYLTCLGFGMGNYKDSKMELLADKGNGNYDYIDDEMEANKTLVHEFGGTLFTVAKDVKTQIEFNPAAVQSYRLVGYENRILNEEDFKDDKKDAGDMGSGHTVTIIYEVVPKGIGSENTRSVDPLKYQHNDETQNNTNEIATVKFRYKQPDGDRSKEIIHIIPNDMHLLQKASDNAQFATSVAMFGMLLKNSKYKGSCTYSQVLHIATLGKGDDKNGYRKEFIELVKTVNDRKDAVGYDNNE